MPTDTREKILQAAFTRLSSQGYENTSIKEIAGEAGVAQGLVHYYFKSKQQLVLAVLMDVCAKLEIYGPELGEAGALAAFENFKSVLRTKRDAHNLYVELIGVGLHDREVGAGIRDDIRRHRTEVEDVARQVLAQRTRERAEFEHKAHHDSLTLLPNRALLVERVRDALARREGADTDVAVMYVDLDDFKTVNDSLGHAAGDALLVQVADRMQISIRPDDIVARLGGDEFAVLMADVANEAEATTVAKRILDSLNAPFEIQGHEIWAHATIGIARARPGEMEVADLLKRADLAMYTAKGEGKSRYAVFGDRMRVSFLEPRTGRRTARG